jgi:hypothetical protein
VKSSVAWAKQHICHPCGATFKARRAIHSDAYPTGGGLQQVGAMNKMTFPNACQVMRWHFHPMGFEGSMDAPSSMVARLFDRSSGETLLAIAGLPCATVMNAADVERIIEAVESELEAFIPSQALKAG